MDYYVSNLQELWKQVSPVEVSLDPESQTRSPEYHLEPVKMQEKVRGCRMKVD